MRAALLRLLPALLAVAASASAANWPQWRGPFLNGSTTETGLPESWSKTENVAWATALPGDSAATPIVWEDRVFVSSVHARTRDLLAICVDAASGRILWQHKTGKDRQTLGDNNRASPSAVTDGRTVWFYYGTGTLVAFDVQGRRLWTRELEEDYGEIVIKWGNSSSPLLYQGTLYIPVLQNRDPKAYIYGKGSDRTGPLESFLLAIDPATGETRWRHVRKTDATKESIESYATPMPFEAYPRPQVVLHAGEYVTGHDAATGQEVWRWEFSPHNRKVWQRTVSSAVTHQGWVYVGRPRHRTFYALKPTGTSTLSDDIVAWRTDENTPDAVTPLLYRDRLYIVHGPRRVITCLDPRTGARHWEGKLPVRPPVRASPTGADGKVYLISKGGDACVLAAGDAFRVLSTPKMGEGPCRASISAAGGRLFIRTGKHLYCVAEP